MSISVADNFSYQGSKPLDARFQFATVASMKAYSEASLYNGCLAYITGTKEYYTYDSSNTVDSTTGRWRIFESGGGGGASALNDLSDVTISSATSGQVLTNNGSGWVNGSVPSDSTKQPKTLDTPLTIDGQSITTVESALSALNNKTASGAVSTEVLDFALSGNITNNVEPNKTKFYYWNYATSGGTITNFNLPELDTTTFPYYSYTAFVILSTTSTGGYITVIYNYATTSTSSVDYSKYARIATKPITKSSNDYLADNEWTYNNTNVVSSGDVDFSNYSFDITKIAVKGKTVFFTGTMTNPTTATYRPIPTSGTLTGTYRYTYFITYPEAPHYESIYAQCFVSNSDDRPTQTRLFTNVYRNVFNIQACGTWVEIGGGGSIDTSKLYSTDDTAETDLADADYIPFYDTSATAKRKSLWSNIKAKLKTYFDTLYQTTLSNATELAKIGEQNGVPTYDGQIISLPNVSHFDKSNIYDTTEKVVGKWIDGRPLYQKTFTGTVPSSGASTSGGSTTLSVNLGTIVNLSHGKLVDGEIKKDTYICTLNNPYSDLYHFAVLFEGNSVVLAMQANGSQIYYMGGSYWITIRYTKTTDAANSFNYASENDYSTSETIVGTWIDGKTLYQRTWTGTLDSTGNATVSISGLGYSEILDIKGTVSYNNNGSLGYAPLGVSSITGTPALNYCFFTVIEAGNIYLINMNASQSSIFKSQKYRVTLQYTKS